ncbi:MAG: sugar transferase [Synergistales bacterium]|nr:sugar transferase [Synergistales bacterium]
MRVNGRNSLTLLERIELDVWYIEQRSLWLDLRILLKTVWVVPRTQRIHGATADEISRTDGLLRGV